MEYCYSGTESLWYGSWNRQVCGKGKGAADRPSRSTGVNPSRNKQRCCSPSCLWSQAQWDTSDTDNSQNLGYWLTIRHRCICKWRWTEMLTFYFQWRAKTVWILGTAVVPFFLSLLYPLLLRSIIMLLRIMELSLSTVMSIILVKKIFRGLWKTATV